MPDRRILTLSEVNDLVRSVIDHHLDDAFWMEAEIAEINEKNGHCYMTLVEKDELSNVPVARASAKCWRNKWEKVKGKFLTVARTEPQRGMKVLLQAKAEFHVAYGFSWIISDIDPTYTLGDLARRRREIIERLKAEGVLDLNRGLTLSPFAQHIAVVSSETAAGYGDFIDQLANNGFGFRFHTTLFNAVMQGEQVEESIVNALSAIFENADNYDAVVIIRGGGSTVDLAGFDTLRLAEHVANFPLPVITGIGHDRDETVLDIVAHTSVKTPTAAAEMLVDNLHATWETLAGAEQTIADIVRRQLDRARMRLTTYITSLPLLVGHTIDRQASRIDKIWQHITVAAEQKMMRENHRIALLTQRADSLDPQRILNKGYSISTKDGKVITDYKQLSPGDIIRTRLAQGSIETVVEHIHP